MREYRDYKHELENCIKKTVGAEVAEDIVQEAFVRFLQKKDIEQPRAWLFKTTRGLARWHLRDRGRHAAIVDPAAFEVVPAQEGNSECDTEAVNLAMKRLPKGDQELLHLSNWKGLNQTEIGKRLGLSEACVWQRSSRARTRLKKILQRTQFACPA